LVIGLKGDGINFIQKRKPENRGQGRCGNLANNSMAKRIVRSIEAIGGRVRKVKETFQRNGPIFWVHWNL
jgi:hypothetical protein